MNVLNNIWSDLKLNAGRSTGQAVNSVTYRFLSGRNANAVYHNNKGYDNVLIYVARQKTMQFVEMQAKSLLPKYKKYLANDKQRKTVLQQQDEYRNAIIEEGRVLEGDLGYITTENGHKITAKDKYGNRVPEALMLHYDTNKLIQVNDRVAAQGEDSAYTNSFTTKTLCFIDLIARVTVSSDKNLVLTQVQGRDFTRKELVSGGDITFNVSGKMVSNSPDIYPENEVKKFVQTMQYSGVVKVNHLVFKQLGVDKIIIKNFNLGTSDCKNEQPYSFSCVAVEPDEAVMVTEDTIGVVNQTIQESSISKWYQLILNGKLDSLASAVVSNTTSAAAKGLDQLVPNI